MEPFAKVVIDMAAVKNLESEQDIDLKPDLDKEKISEHKEKVEPSEPEEDGCESELFEMTAEARAEYRKFNQSKISSLSSSSIEGQLFIQVRSLL